MRKPSSLAIALVAALTATTPPVASANDVPPVGSVAPVFTLSNNECGNTSLSEFRGRWVVLYFYPKAKCTSLCSVEARYFQRDLAKYQQARAVILGVSVDTPESHRDFCAREGLTFSLLSDPAAKVSAEYGSAMESKGSKVSTRNTFVIDPDGKIARAFLKVKVVGHSEEVLAALAELQKH